MSEAERDDRELARLDQLVGRITLGTSGDDQALRAFRQALEDVVALPCDGLVTGEPVSVAGFGYDGDPRRGLRARCRCQSGSEFQATVSDVVLARGSDGARHVAAYRGWLGLDPFPPPGDQW